MSFIKTSKFFTSLLRTSIRSSISLRGAFLLESGLMIANNLIFFFIWWVFFRAFDQVAGWRLNDMAALMAVAIGGLGLMQICFGAVKNLSKIIVSGDLDPYMTQPKNLLLHLAGSRSFSKGWGHLMTSVFLIWFGGFATFSLLPLVLLGMICACIIFSSTGIIAHSMAFWFGSIDTLARRYSDTLYLFSLYPSHIYSGLLQLVMYTLIPAGIIGFLPVEIIRSFTWMKLFILVGSAASFSVLAGFIFHLGLKRYESGNQFGMRL